MRKAQILFSIFVFLTLSLAVNAQIGPISAGVILDITPLVPKAGDEITIKARSLAFDMSRANVRWYINGSVAASGTGVDSVKRIAGPVGSVLNISVEATAPDGRFFEESTIIFITDIDLIVNALSYVPNFYRGSSLPTPASKMEIIAVPFLYFQGVRLSPDSLFYEWSISGNKVKSLSGQGKNKITLNIVDVSSFYDIGVEVSSNSNVVSSKRSLTFNTHNPKTLFYQTNFLTGPRKYATNSFLAATDSNIAIKAEPYFFDLDSFANAVINWTSNNAKLDQESGDPLLLNIFIPPEAVGRSIFTFNISKLRSIYQNSAGTLSVETFSPQTN